MSKDNQDLEASVIKSLFLGNIIEENVFPFPSYPESELETVQLINESVDRFMDGREEEFREFDQKGDHPTEFITQLKELGLFGLIIPEEYEGLGLTSRGFARVVQQCSKYDGSATLTFGAHSSIGMKGVLLHGTEEQKKKYLPRLASGELIAAFCLTESGSGSDAASIKTTATKNDDGSWALTGEKLWITNGPIAGFFTVFARTDSGDQGKLSAFIVESDWEGISTGPKEDKMGIRASCTTTVRFENVRVPADCLLGDEGKGFKIAMSILNSGRTGLGGGCVGALKRCIKLSTHYASQRKQFGRRISDYELIKEKIAQMTVDCYVAESVVNLLGHYIDSGSNDYSVEAAASKVFASEALWRGSNEALQIAGGNGYMKEYPYERQVRDARINLIFEGTNEILRMFIALSGLKDVGADLKEIGKAAGNIFNEPIKGFGVMSDYVSKRFGQLTSLGTDRLEVHPDLRNEAKIYELATLGLAKVSNKILRQYKRDIIGKQFISKRLADVAIDLFAGLSTLSRVDTKLRATSAKECAQEIKILQIFTQQAKQRMKAALASVERPEDQLRAELADYIVDLGEYPWDVL